MVNILPSLILYKSKIGFGSLILAHEKSSIHLCRTLYHFRAFCNVNECNQFLDRHPSACITNSSFRVFRRNPARKEFPPFRMAKTSSAGSQPFKAHRAPCTTDRSTASLSNSTKIIPTKHRPCSLRQSASIPTSTFTATSASTSSKRNGPLSTRSRRSSCLFVAYSKVGSIF